MSFWFEDITSLFFGYTIIPNPDDTVEEQLNSITRGIIVLWLFLYGIEFKYHSVFLINSLIFIIILYYIQINQMKDNYTDSFPIKDWTRLPKDNNLKAQTSGQYRFCLDDKEIIPDKRFNSPNQQLAGGIQPNPKTLTPPTIAAPVFAFDFWSNNETVATAINDSTYQEMYQSGYLGSSTCGSNVPNPVRVCSITDASVSVSGSGDGIVEGFSSNPHSSQMRCNQTNASNYSQQSCQQNLLGCTYNTEQLAKHNIPVNQIAGQCQKRDALNEYNKNLYTQMMTDDTYIRNDVIEPVSSNMGITYAQQFHPTSTSKDGKTMIIRNDCDFIPEPQAEKLPFPTNANVYDPRSFGYGTSYRGYVDDLTGQPRFTYDDVDAVRRPRYIVRSNIDRAIWAQSYGDIDEKHVGNIPYKVGHAMAHEQFMIDTLEQRNQIQQSVSTNYANKIGWQRRIAPLSRDQR